MVTTSESISVLAPPGLVSIMIPCCGMLEYTKLCVPSVLKYSREPIELIFLDIGSLDGTAEYLAGLQAGPASRLRVEVVRAQTDLDIPDVCKEALARVRGDFVCLLNNDAVVTPFWLEAMTGLLKTSPARGMVGPMSNYAAPPQLVEVVPYRTGPRKGVGDGPLVDTAAVEAFARDYSLQHKGKWMEVERLGGFCLLLKRDVLKKIDQELQPWTDLGLFDTDILSAKVRQAGYTLGCCRDLFIHHFGTRTFAHGAPSSHEVREHSRTGAVRQ